MDRATYNKCIRPYITGSKPKEQRRLDFCIGAKVCSGKAKDRVEAEKLCSLPKEPKITKAKLRSPETCEKEVVKLARCMSERIDMNLASNVNSIEVAIINSMMECRCPSQK